MKLYTLFKCGVWASLLQLEEEEEAGASEHGPLNLLNSRKCANLFSLSRTDVNLRDLEACLLTVQQ